MVIDHSTQLTLNNYSRAIAVAKTLIEALDLLGQLRSKEVYMALLQNHAECFVIQNSKSFSKVLKNADLTREEHLLNGARRCRYRIKARWSNY